MIRGGKHHIEPERCYCTSPVMGPSQTTRRDRQEMKSCGTEGIEDKTCRAPLGLPSLCKAGASSGLVAQDKLGQHSSAKNIVQHAFNQNRSKSLMSNSHEAIDVSARKPPLLNWRGVVLSLICAVLLSWPMLFTSVPLGMFDTFAYFDVGKDEVEMLSGMAAKLLPDRVDVGWADASVVAKSEHVADQPKKPQQFRSFVYSAYIYTTSLTRIGLYLPVLLQTSATLLMFFSFVASSPRASWLRLGGAALFVGTLTTLPWFASYAMPDILAALVVLYYVLLVERIDRLQTGWQVAFMAITAFAVSCHYGHLPLAAGLIGVILVLRLFMQSLTLRVVVLAASPLAIAVFLNLFGSAIALDKMEFTPKRIPILLARSIDDGPAYWYLQDACPKAQYTICKVMPVIPRDMGTFLWTEKGIGRATREELDKIRAEEATVLWHAFLAYPAEQTYSLLRNTAQQIVQVGTGEIHPLLPSGSDGLGLEPGDPDQKQYRAFAVFDVVTKVGTALGIGLLLSLWLKGELRGPEVRTIAVCLLGLVGNALIFGGLSAPVDRYQSRVIWILPAFAFLYWLGAHQKAGP